MTLSPDYIIHIVKQRLVALAETFLRRRKTVPPVIFLALVLFLFDVS